MDDFRAKRSNDRRRPALPIVDKEEAVGNDETP